MVQLAALGVQNPQIDALGAFQKGQRHAAGMDEAKREAAEKSLQLIGAASMHALGGDINGQADPGRFEEGLDMLESQGIDVSKFRGKPQLAGAAARASVTAMQQLQLAQDDRQFEMLMQKFGRDVMESDRQFGLARETLDFRKHEAMAGDVPGGYRQTANGLEAIPGGPADPENPINIKRIAPPSLSATDKKAVWEAEDQMPVIDNTIATLKRAKELNEKTAEGAGANQLGRFGTFLPDAIEPESAAPTREYLDIMTQEAAATMSEILKGATTDRELKIFMDIIADTTKPREQRARALDRLITLAERKKEIAQNRINEIKPVGPEPSDMTDMGDQPIYARNPKTGERMVLQDGQWVPAQ